MAITWPTIAYGGSGKVLPVTHYLGDSMELEFPPSIIEESPPYTIRIDASRDGAKVTIGSLDVELNQEPTLNVAPEDIPGLVAGAWRYRAFITKDQTVTTIEVGVILVDDPTADTVTRAEGIAAQLEDILSGKLTGRKDVAGYTIGDRSVTTYSVQDLTSMIAYWRELANYQLHGRGSRRVGGFNRQRGTGNWPF